jgi:hypothetical protein
MNINMLYGLVVVMTTTLHTREQRNNDEFDDEWIEQERTEQSKSDGGISLRRFRPRVIKEIKGE